MLLTALLITLAATGQKPAVPWRRDIPQAFADAEEHGRPLLLWFRVACGSISTPGATDSLGRSLHGSEKTDCDLMEEDVYSQADVAGEAGRFMPVLAGEQGQPAFNLRYNVTQQMTVLADPWGNEIVKLVGYTHRERLLRILKAVPTDFAPLRSAARAIQQDPVYFAALVAIASFYEAAGLREFADRYYERAQASPDTRPDPAARREAVLAQGMNLMQMGKHAEAAQLFERTLKQAPDGPLADAMLLGRVLAELERGRKKDAQRAFEELQRRFPESPYTARARQQLGGR